MMIMRKYAFSSYLIPLSLNRSHSHILGDFCEYKSHYLHKTPKTITSSFFLL